MIVLIILFYISLLTIIGMVVWKLIVLHELKLSFIEGAENDLHGKFYERVHELWHTFSTTHLRRARAFALMVLYTALHEVFRVTLIIGQKIKVRHSKWHDIVKGKGAIHKKGSVSFFLRDVAEYKKTLGNK